MLPVVLRAFYPLVLLALAFAAPAARAAELAPDKASATLVKAAFLHKFASFVDWPQGSFPKADSPLKIGVVGDAQIWHELADLSRHRDRDGRPVTVARLAPTDPLGGYHILYLRASSAARMAELLSSVPEGVLTVADFDGAHPKGSVMSFFLDEGRVRFGVSLEAANRQRLRLSSRLLAVARSLQGMLHGDAVVALLAPALRWS